MRPGEVTDEMVERMVELRRDGWAISAIARELGVSRPTVQARLSRHDASLREDRHADRSCLVTSTAWLRLPPARLRLQLAAEGR